MNGLKSATSSWVTGTNEINGDNTQSVRIQGYRDIEFQRAEPGRYLIQTYREHLTNAGDPPRIILYNGVLGISGNVAELPQDSNPTPDPTPNPEPNPNPNPESHEDWEYVKIGNPLRIHYGPKSNINLAVHINDMHTKAMGLDNVSLITREKSVNAPEKIDNAIEYALNENTRMGAYQARLDFIHSNLVVAHENTISSESVIRDKEMTEYTKLNVLAQSSQAMLAQANQNLSGVLSLLQ